MENLMENVANLSVRGNSEAEGAEEDSETAVESSEVPVACEESYRSHCVHYKRGCSIVSPCCGATYSCRICHDETETHKYDRYALTEVVCRKCCTKQPVGSTCSECGIVFGRYFCSVCNLFDDEEKGQFHCQDCGICRVGGQENYFHCGRCGLCLPVTVKGSHTCIQNVSRANCPICMEDIHTSRDSAHIPPACGHLLHSKCFKEMLNNGLYRCPICNKSLVNMKDEWERIDRERNKWQLPPQFRNFMVKVQCSDCHEESQTQYHFVGLKCVKCGSYNTARSGSEEIPGLDDNNDIHSDDSDDESELETDEEEEESENTGEEGEEEGEGGEGGEGEEDEEGAIELQALNAGRALLPFLENVASAIEVLRNNLAVVAGRIGRPPTDREDEDEDEDDEDEEDSPGSPPSLSSGGWDSEEEEEEEEEEGEVEEENDLDPGGATSFAAASNYFSTTNNRVDNDSNDDYDGDGDGDDETGSFISSHGSYRINLELNAAPDLPLAHISASVQQWSASDSMSHSNSESQSHSCSSSMSWETEDEEVVIGGEEESSGASEDGEDDWETGLNVSNSDGDAANSNSTS